MAQREPIFIVRNAPGPFLLTKELIKMLDEGSFPKMRLCLETTLAAHNLLGVEQGIKPTNDFEVSLLGPAPRGFARFLGRFIPDERWGLVEPLGQRRWEVVLNSNRTGFVYLLEHTLD